MAAGGPRHLLESLGNPTVQYQPAGRSPRQYGVTLFREAIPWRDGPSAKLTDCGPSNLCCQHWQWATDSCGNVLPDDHGHQANDACRCKPGSGLRERPDQSAFSRKSYGEQAGRSNPEVAIAGPLFLPKTGFRRRAPPIPAGFREHSAPRRLHPASDRVTAQIAGREPAAWTDRYERERRAPGSPGGRPPHGMSAPATRRHPIGRKLRTNHFAGANEIFGRSGQPYLAKRWD